MYPETKGVPLEEMDAVFGEGVSCVIIMTHILTLITSDQRQENIDNESETTSLVRSFSYDSEYLRSTRGQTNDNNDSANWFVRLFKRSRRGHYEQIEDN